MSESPPAIGRRADRLIAACAAILLLGLLFYAGNDWAMVLYRLLSDGLIAVLWIVAAYGWGDFGFWILGFGLNDSPKSKIQNPKFSRCLLRTLTAAGLGLGGFSIAFLLLGLVGWLHFWIVLAVIVIGAALAVWPLRHGFGHVTFSLKTRWQWLWLAVMPWLAMALVASLVPPGVLWRGEPNGYDVVEYHLEVPREWYQNGAIRPLEHNVFSYMPMNVEMQYLAAMELRGGPWAGMYLAQYLHAAFILLTVLAIYAFAAEMGANQASAILAGVAAATVPWLSLLAPIAYNEGGLLLFGTLSIGWAMLGNSWKMDEANRTRHFSFSIPHCPWILAGLFAGFACGVKLTAVPMIWMAIPVAVMGVWIVARWILSRNLKPKTRNPIPALILFVLAGLLAFAPWLIRNQVWAGNPVYPELMPLLGANRFTPVQVERYQKAHAPRPDQQSISAHLRAGWNQITADWAYGYVLLPVGLLGGAFGLFGSRRRETLFLWILLILLAVIWIGFTHLQSRFFILCIPILAWMIAQVNWRAWQWPLAGLILLAGAAGFARLNAQLMPWLEPGLLGLENFQPFMQELVPPEAVRPIEAGRSLALVGDARAFLYQMPIGRLHYRTVFDVSAAPGEDLIHAWLGGTSADLVVVDPSELRRLTRTYQGLPPLPANVAERDRPFVYQPTK